MSGHRDPQGRFKKGAPPGPGRRPGQRVAPLMMWARQALEDPDRRREMLERVDREIRGEGAVPVLTLLVRYAHGEPRQVHAFEASRTAARIAQAAGLDVAILVGEASRLAALVDEEMERIQ